MAKLQIGAVLFDNDGVLIDSYHKGILAHQHVAKKLKLRVPAAHEFQKLWGRHWREILVPTLWPNDAERFVTAYLPHYNTLRYATFPKLMRTLEYLRSLNIPLGVVTNRDRETFEHRLEQAGITLENFTHVQTADDTPYRKPDPRVFEALWLKLKPKLGKDEIVYVGDTLDDYQAARAFGFQFIGVTSGPTTKSDFNNAGLPLQRIVQQPADILAVLEIPNPKQPSP